MSTHSDSPERTLNQNRVFERRENIRLSSLRKLNREKNQVLSEPMTHAHAGRYRSEQTSPILKQNHVLTTSQTNRLSNSSPENLV